MHLTDGELKELNSLLKNSNLDLPKFRRVVTKTGANFSWLQRNIGFRNKNLSARLLHLLGQKRPLSTESHLGDDNHLNKEALATQDKPPYNDAK